MLGLPISALLPAPLGPVTVSDIYSLRRGLADVDGWVALHKLELAIDAIVDRDDRADARRHIYDVCYLIRMCRQEFRTYTERQWCAVLLILWRLSREMKR